ncbi:Phosphatidylinositol 4-kinase pik1alpha (PI4-kinase)(PtdIns-4-kinase) [Saitozyma podzolica]|uniref:1-phosphatidylinositol 4-kinase n=1 Tax=Saitozyma podzolica TaxID=1890683 RepID=A0A427YHD9_9TREE|nr:Phosphatidylinositol 4-kinase pik1alpha (PI4-kinase)(PtdIns-4-kinase) [Saitozyma podzolica]
MSHALLLRLFLSPYFSISVAMHYLKTYPDSIGISHYLCWRMKAMPAEEVEFYWPQICHLLITYPTQSNALEAFVLQRAEESTHSAMLTFWFMQAALRDLTPTRQTTPRPFLICQRVLHRCHEILFGDPPEPSNSPYRSLPHSPPSSTAALHSGSTMFNLLAPSSRSERNKTKTRINPYIPPALVGMGVMLASAPGMRGLVDLAGDWAVTQGRRPRDEETESRARVEVQKGGGADVPVGGRRVEEHLPSEEMGQDSDEELPSGAQSARPIVDKTRSRSSGLVPPISAPPNGSTHHLPHRPAMTAPNLHQSRSSADIPASPPSRSGSPRHQNASDPFSQHPPTPPGISITRNGSPSKGHQPFYSVPELSRSASARRMHSADRAPPADALLATYSLDAQRQLLRSHFCRSEIRFLLLLEDISNRLLVIPKPARVSALRAELTSLNHNLPAEVCMPLWCAADHSHEEGGETSSSTPLRSRLDRPRTARKKAHSRVVRISPGDSVVLNSAERAPYLLHVEILEGDLDFDPTRRENRELLKKIVVQEDMKRRKKESGSDDHHTWEGFGAPMPEALPPAAPETHSRQPSGEVLSPAQRREAKPDEIEEMDLVEQLYGELSVRDQVPDLSESLPMPNAPKNKALDMAAWERGVSTDLPSRRPSLTPTTTHVPSFTDITVATLTPAANGYSGASPSPSAPQTPNFPSSGLMEEPATFTPKRIITLEDYSERMRTAAVMLAQLNASLVPAPEGQGGGKLSWIPGTGWITGGGKQSDAPSSPAMHAAAAIRERIMEEMMALEEERVTRMTELPEGVSIEGGKEGNTAEDEGIVRRELNKADPSAAVFRESWTAKKSRIRASSPWGHLANWDVISVIVKTGTDLRQEQLATQLIERFSRIWKEEKCDCWVRFFRILITGETSGLVETITDAVSVHSIKKGEYARRISEGGPIGHVSLMDHFVNTYGKPDSGQFARARRNFIKSLAGYSIVTYLLQIKDRHNGNILVDREGHLIHIDFGFMLSNSPGGTLASRLRHSSYLWRLDSPSWVYFKKLFKEGFEAARKHSDSLITIVELMQKNSKLDCFTLFGDQTSAHFRERFALGLTTSAVDAYLERLIVTSTGSNYTRLYDTFQYYSQGVL